jgi:hypothetical protein
MPRRSTGTWPILPRRLQQTPIEESHQDRIKRARSKPDLKPQLIAIPPNRRVRRQGAEHLHGLRGGTACVTHPNNSTYIDNEVKHGHAFSRPREERLGEQHPGCQRRPTLARHLAFRPWEDHRFDQSAEMRHDARPDDQGNRYWRMVLRRSHRMQTAHRRAQRVQLVCNVALTSPAPPSQRTQIPLDIVVPGIPKISTKLQWT